MREWSYPKHSTKDRKHNDVNAQHKWRWHEWEDHVIIGNQNSDSNSINFSHLGLVSHNIPAVALDRKNKNMWVEANEGDRSIRNKKVKFKE